MLKCKNCGWDLSDDTRVCTYCGRPVEPEDEEQRRRLMLRWHLSALLIGMKGPKYNFPFSPALSAKSSTRHVPAALIVLVISVLIFLNIILIGSLRPQNGPPVTPTPFTFTFPPHISVNPTLLDFGKVEIGSQAVLPVMIKTSSESQISWKIVSGDAQWLSITLQSETKESDNLREVIYDVTVNTSKLQAGRYSVTFTINSDGAAQQVHVKIQVIPPGPPPAAKLNVSPLLLDFGSQEVGKQKTLLLTVSNSGEKELDWMADKGKTTWLTLDTSGGKIAPGEPPQIINVRVDTTRLTAGLRSASINLTSNAGHVSVRVVLLVSTPTSVNGPIVSSINPGSGPVNGGTSVIIMGSNFTGTTAISFGSTAASNFTVNGDTQITAISPAGSDLVDVTVTTLSGTSATSTADQFTYIPSPTVTGISPQCGVGDISNVIITGTNFTGATRVSFGSTAASNFKVDSDTQITATSGPGLGTVDVTVTTPSGTSPTSAADQFIFPSSPLVSSISPASGPDAGGTGVTITGTNLTCATSVSFGSTAVSHFKVDSDTQITVASPAGSNTVDVIVTTPGGTSPTSAADQFTYIPTPAVTGITPTNGLASGGTSVIIMGSGFTNATAVSFGSTAASYFKVDSDTQITASSPAGSGTVDVTVTTPGGTSTTSSADQFTYIPPPAVTGITPTSGPINGGTMIIITGTGFTGATTVSFGSVAAKGFRNNSDTQITVFSPPVHSNSNSTVDVTVTTPGGTSPTSAADQFTYFVQPAVYSVNPTSGSTDGGTNVTITGFGFTGATSVLFGSTAATSLKVSSDGTQITAVSPAGSGTVDVTVTTPGGTSTTSADDQFTYIPPPTVTGISPTSGLNGGGTMVVITGTGFTGATTVSFGSASVAANGFTINSDTQITIVSPPASSSDFNSTVDVTVTTPSGTSATSAADQFTYQ